MYDDLIKRLREKADAFDYDGRPDIACDYEQAAEAIEELDMITDNLNYLYKTEVPKWIPVTERLPEKNQIVVVVQHGKTWDYGQFRGLAYLGGNIHKWNWKNNTTKTVDYWMPKKSALPQPPKEE